MNRHDIFIGGLLLASQFLKLYAWLFHKLKITKKRYQDNFLLIVKPFLELTAAGWTAQTPVLKSIAFQVSTNSTTVLNSFTIKVTHTSAASYTNSNFLSGTTLVSTYTGTITTTNGWNTYTFPTPFNYNQTSNLLITVSFNNNIIGTNSIVQSTILNEYKSIFRRENITSGTISQSSIGTQSYYRPNMRLVFGPSNSTATTAKSQFEEEAIITLMTDKSAEIIVSPNPLSAMSSLKFYTKNINFDSTVQIDVVDQNGRILYSNSSFNLSNNENFINFVSPIEKGNYFIRLICNEGVISERFMVE